MKIPPHGGIFFAFSWHVFWKTFTFAFQKEDSENPEQSRKHFLIIKTMKQFENLFNELDARLDLHVVTAEWCDNFAQSYPD